MRLAEVFVCGRPVPVSPALDLRQAFALTANIGGIAEVILPRKTGMLCLMLCCTSELLGKNSGHFNHDTCSKILEQAVKA